LAFQVVRIAVVMRSRVALHAGALNGLLAPIGLDLLCARYRSPVPPEAARSRLLDALRAKCGLRAAAEVARAARQCSA